VANGQKSPERRPGDRPQRVTFGRASGSVRRPATTGGRAGGSVRRSATTGIGTDSIPNQIQQLKLAKEELQSKITKWE
jgi:hypothetical protein